jgi:hypothetical protein
LQDKAGRWFSLRARPYVTGDNRIDGAVLVLVDIHTLKTAEQSLRQAHECARAVVEAVPPLLILGEDLRVQAANESFYRAFQVTPADTQNRLIYELGNGQWDIPALRLLLENVLPKNAAFTDYEVTHEFETIGRRTMLLSSRRADPIRTIVLSVQDITARKEAEDALRQAKDSLVQYSSQLEQLSHTLVHDMANCNSGVVCASKPHFSCPETRVLGYASPHAAASRLCDHGVRQLGTRSNAP